MTLFPKLEAGISVPGFYIFGDNAYLYTPYMATPNAGVSGGAKDSFELNVPLEYGHISGQYSEAQYQLV